MIVTAALFCNDLLITLAVCSGQTHTIVCSVNTSILRSEPVLDLFQVLT